jgi:hypothetical protein
MPRVNLIVASPEEAADDNAEFWVGHEQWAVTVLHEGTLHLRIDPRPDGEPWLVDAITLAQALASANRQLATY